MEDSASGNSKLHYREVSIEYKCIEQLLLQKYQPWIEWKIGFDLIKISSIITLIYRKLQNVDM